MSKQERNLYTPLAKTVERYIDIEDVSSLNQLLATSDRSVINGVTVDKVIVGDRLKIYTDDSRSYLIDSCDIYNWWIFAVRHNMMLAATVLAFNPMFKLPVPGGKYVVTELGLDKNSYVSGMISYLERTGNIMAM